MERAHADTALRESEARLRAAQQRQHIAADAAGLGIWEWRIGEDEAVWGDGRIYDIFGVPHDSPPLNYEQLVRDFIHPEDRQHLEKAVAEGLETGSFRAACRITRASDGALRWVEYSGRLEPDEDGTDRLIGAIADITERKQAAERQNILMAELDHRVKNILAVVQSIAQQSLGRGRDSGPEAADRLIGRINALAQSHSLLAGSRWQGARFGDLVESAVAPYRGERTDRVIAEGPLVKVTPKAAQTLTLALHELVTNAAKYGALSCEEGRVSAEWDISCEGEDRRLVFTWQEHGGPTLEAPPSRKGFGSRLIERALAYELDAEVRLEFAGDGLRAFIDLPLGKLREEDGQSDHSRPRSATPSLVGDRSTLQGKRLLVVEDEHLVGEETADTLRSAGSSVTGPVSKLHDALTFAVAEDFDGAVLDINLNGDLVWPAARALNARGIPFVFASGYSETIEMPTDLAGIHRIEKPIKPDRLVTALAAAVAGIANA